MKQIDLCNDLQISLFEKSESIVSICQICLILVFVVLELFLISTFIKSSNQFWTTISQNAYDSFFEIRNICCERLKNHLQIREEEVQVYYEMLRTSKNIFHMGAGQILGYSWRFLIMISLSILYIIIIVNILVPQLNDLTRNKNDLIDSISQRKFQMQRIELLSFSKEKNKCELDQVIKSFTDFRKSALFNQYSGLIEQKVLEMIYDQAGNSELLKFGWHSAGTLLLTDYYYRTPSNLLDLRTKSLHFYSKTDEIIKEVNKTSIEKLDDLYTKTLITVISFSFFWVLFYIILNHSYLRRKAKTVQSFLNIFKFFILVENSITG